jgi:hypothetical protein
MKKHNCLKWVEEGQGCSICHNSLLAHTGADWLKAIEQTNWVIVEQTKKIEELEYLNKKLQEANVALQELPLGQIKTIDKLDSYVKLLKESRRKYQRLLGEEHKKSIDERMKDAEDFLVAINIKQRFIIADLERQLEELRKDKND